MKSLALVLAALIILVPPHSSASNCRTSKEFSLPSHQQLNGALVDSEGKPIWGLTLQLRNKGKVLKSVETSENGSYDLGLVSAGTYQLHVVFPYFCAPKVSCSPSGCSLSSKLKLGGFPPAITIREPGRFSLEELFQSADIVAKVKVLSGDSENYKGRALYKSTVISSFKGSATGRTIYFGPYLGNRIGWEYYVFLKTVPKPATPTGASGLDYGTVPSFDVFNEGYSQMVREYECGSGFGCAYAVRICTDYVVPPEDVRTYPPRSDTTPFGCRFILETEFEELLQKVKTAAESKK
jgi:hypothetical protein